MKRVSKKPSTARSARPAAGKPAKQLSLSHVQFHTELLKPRATSREAMPWKFLVLPKDASRALPSRGQVTVQGRINDTAFQATLQPDGQGGHWLMVDDALCETAGVQAGQQVRVECAPVLNEPEPEVPADLHAALLAAPAKAREAWSNITPAARRDFIHWITSPKRPETRVKRIATACDMLAKGKRRPCCFDRSGMYDKSQRCPVADDHTSRQ